MKKESSKAFSLIELSIVVLIIGILIAGVSQGSRLFDKFRVHVARNLTTSSPVNGIKGIVFWYETSLKDSFESSEAEDGLNISQWHDINPQVSVKNDATQTSTSSPTPRPLYKEKMLNGLPAVVFDGSNDFLSFDGSSLVATEYTIFVVEERTNPKSNNFFMGGNGSTDNNIALGYYMPTRIVQSHFGPNYVFFDILSDSYVPRIHCFSLNSSVGKIYYLNNATTTPTKTNSYNSLVNSYPNSSIGRYMTYFYEGYVFEVIAFNRILTSEERISVVKYLGSKYRINISS